MRSTRELLIVILVIAAAVAGLHRWRTGRPSRISGMVVDISTGHPVAGVRVCPKFLNGHGEGVPTDSRGRFTMPVRAPGNIVGIFVDDPKYAGLFGNLVGREGHALRQGEQDDGEIVPAIPAAELSGKVLDDGSHPISGCKVELFRPRNLYGPLQLVAANLDVRTGPGGEYKFMHLDAGIYYLLAKCNTPSRTSYLRSGEESTAPKEQKVWANLLYPHANKLSEAQAVTAMPGQRISGLDFRLIRTTGFLLKGRFIWADKYGPQQRDVYSDDFSLTSLDLGLAQNQTESTCRWNTYPGRFECTQITPGRYRLFMNISPVWIEADRGHTQGQNDQAGEADVNLTDEAPAPVALEMQRTDGGVPDTTPTTFTRAGWLDVQVTGCGSHEFQLVNFKIWDENGMHAPVVNYAREGRHAGEPELRSVQRRFTGWQSGICMLRAQSAIDPDRAIVRPV